MYQVQMDHDDMPSSDLVVPINNDISRVESFQSISYSAENRH